MKRSSERATDRATLRRSSRESSIGPAGLALDSTSSSSMYRELYDKLRTAILEGRLWAGARLPSSRSLAQELAIARNTVMSAYEQLLAEGYLEGKTGSGTYVARTLPDAVLTIPTPRQAAPRNRNRFHLSCRGQTLATNRLGVRYMDPPRPFRPGVPAIDHFPFDLWSHLLAKYWRLEPAGLLPYTDPAGYQPLREAVATYISAARAVRCDPEQIIVVSGAQQALDLATRLLLDPEDEVWMEDPGYNGARAVFLAAGVKPVGVPIDNSGLDVTRGEKLSPRARLAYVTPSHQYPTGVVMTLSRRLELLRWAERRRSWILEDDYDSEYRYASRPVASLQGLDNSGSVIYCGTFSKVLFPSLRLGYIVVPASLVDAFRGAKAVVDRHCPTVEQAVLAEFIAEGHLARHIRRMRVLYLERKEALLDILRRELAGAVEVRSHEAGMHVVGWLQKGKRDSVVSRRALELGVEAPALTSYREKPGGRGGLVLGYAAYSEPQLLSAVRTLAKAME